MDEDDDTRIDVRGAQVSVRDAQEEDIPALAAIKGAGSEALHRDRLQDARWGSLRYLVMLVDGDLIGFACLIFRRPAYWSDAADTQNLPQMVDLQVAKARRGQGWGSAFVGAVERAALEAGYDQLYLSVEPLHNPRAFALYQRLGYRALQAEPYQKAWAFTDSSGKLQSGEDVVLDMVKTLAGGGLIS
jgi:GNAT superfamily N-acetyltransferase